MWHLISNAPFDRDLELALIDANGVHAICFPCRRVLGGWIKAEMKTRINVRPTHWRDWAKDSYKAGFSNRWMPRQRNDAIVSAMCAGLFSYHFVHIYIVRRRYGAAFLRP